MMSARLEVLFSLLVFEGLYASKLHEKWSSATSSQQLELLLLGLPPYGGNISISGSFSGCPPQGFRTSQRVDFVGIFGPGTIDCELTGSAFFLNSSRVTIKGVTILRALGQAGGWAGALAVPVPSTELHLLDCVFQGCIEDGAVMVGLAAQASVFIARCRFLENSYTPQESSGGGAVTLYTAATQSSALLIRMQQVTCDKNFGSSGCLYLQVGNPGTTCNVSVGNCTFVGNVALPQQGTAVGGAVGIVTEGALFLDTTSTIFLNNVANCSRSSCTALGGALGVVVTRHAASELDVTIANCTMTQNRVLAPGAEATGGSIGVIVNGLVRVFVSLRHTILRSNVAEAAMALGGAIAIIEPDVSSDDLRTLWSVPGRGMTFTSTGNEYSSNVATGWAQGGRGGAIYYRCNAERCHNQTVLLNTDKWIQNSVSGPGAWGGGVFVLGRSGLQSQAPGLSFRAWTVLSAASVLNAEFDSNFALGSHAGGGALAVQGFSCLVSGSIFTSNKASNSGGALVATGTASITASHTTFRFNQAGWAGTAIFSNAGAKIMFETVEFYLVGEGVGIELTQTGQFSLGRKVTAGCPSGNDLDSAGPLMYTTFFPGWIAAMNASAWRVSCQPCRAGTYAFDFGRLSSTARGFEVDVEHPLCRECPLGARCHGGDAVAVQGGFWGASAPSGRLHTYRCPAGYCCDRGNCTLSAQCAGGRVGTLCGSCPSGTSQSLFSPRCVSGNCGKVWASVVLLSVGSAVLRIVTIKKEKTDATLYALLSFYQLLPFVSVDLPASVAKPDQDTSNTNHVLAAVSRIASLRSAVDGCPFRGATAADSIAMNLVLPALTLVLIPPLQLLWRRVTRQDSKEHLLPAMLFDTLMTAYATVAQTVFDLSTCKQIQGHSRFFFDGNVLCVSTWQIPAFLAMALVVLPFPVLLVVLGWWQEFRTLERPAFLGDLLQRAAGPFSRGLGFWPGILISHRVVIVGLQAGVSDVAVRSVSITVFCCFFVVLHAHVRPFATYAAQMFGVLTYANLAAISVTSVYFTALLENGVSPVSDTVPRTLSAVRTAFSLLPGVVWLCSATHPWLRRLAHRVGGTKPASSSGDIQLTVFTS